MNIKEFKHLSRQNNYYVLIEPMPVPNAKTKSLSDTVNAKKCNTLIIKRGSKIISLIPLINGHKMAEFTNYPPKISKAEFNLIKEFTHNN